MFYTVPGATPLLQLMQDALTLAHSTGHDVFNALDIFENQKILKGARAPPGTWDCLVLHSHCNHTAFLLLRGFGCVAHTLLSPAGPAAVALGPAVLPCSLPPAPAAACPPSCLSLPAELKFGVGDGKLRYYLFNWRVAQEIPPSGVGLVML
jgi:hypothetical protein